MLCEAERRIGKFCLLISLLRFPSINVAPVIAHHAKFREENTLSQAKTRVPRTYIRESPVFEVQSFGMASFGCLNMRSCKLLANESYGH
jgi:hypothetical protein